MKNYEYLQVTNFVDPGGYYNLELRNAKLQFRNQEWKYLASGLSRDVFVSEDGKSVLKIPQRVWKDDIDFDGLKMEDRWEFGHNRLEVECYNEAPEWCKKYIAKSEITEEGFEIQEFVNVHYIGDAYWRELGYREDGTQVIFDCDIFLSTDFKKPKTGFKYQEVFSKSKAFKEAYIEANEIPKRKRIKEKKAVEKYYPGVIDGTHFQLTSGGYGGSHAWVIPNESFRPDLSKEEKEQFKVPLAIAIECGFITED